MARSVGGLFLSHLLLVEVPHNACDVSAGFVIGGHASKLLDPLRSGIICGKRLDKVEVVFLQKFPQIFGAAFDIGLRIEGVAYT